MFNYVTCDSEARVTPFTSSTMRYSLAYSGLTSHNPVAGEVRASTSSSALLLCTAVTIFWMLINVDNDVLKEISSDLDGAGDVEPVAAALVGQHAAELPELRHLHPRPAQLRLHAADLRPGKLDPPH